MPAWLSFETWTLLRFAQSPLTWLNFGFGALIGSFLNVCILRIPHKSFFQNSRSMCPSCGEPIPVYLNIPILSYFILRGRARCCGARLSMQYPLVEFFSALMFVAVYWKYPFVGDLGGRYIIDHAEAIRYFHALIFCCLLLICSVIDIHHMIIPDVISLPMIALSPLVVYVHPDLTWQSSLIGVVIGGASLYAIAWIYWLIRHEVGMGMGDVKLLAGIGGWLGYQAILPTIFYGSMLGAFYGLTAMVISRKLTLKTAIPFGPFLAIGAVVHLFIGFQLREWFFL